MFICMFPIVYIYIHMHIQTYMHIEILANIHAYRNFSCVFCIKFHHICINQHFFCPAICLGDLCKLLQMDQLHFLKLWHNIPSYSYTTVYLAIPPFMGL